MPGTDARSGEPIPTRASWSDWREGRTGGCCPSRPIDEAAPFTATAIRLNPHDAQERASCARAFIPS